MKPGLWGLVIVIVFAVAAAGGVADGRHPASAASVGASRPDAPLVTQAKGRYKKQGTACVWDANDSGPNQCTPVTEGRFKKNGDTCVWDASDRGPDQCTPRTGRFKKEGDKCVWNASDSGPNQCDPRQPR
jgi:hypothetical protein